MLRLCDLDEDITCGVVRLLPIVACPRLKLVYNVLNGVGNSVPAIDRLRLVELDIMLF